MATNARIHPIILCGGSGTRLWPLSRPQFPKQFLRFGSDQSLLSLTLQRVAIPLCAAPIIACCAHQRPLLEKRHIEQAAAVLLEPSGRGTALISAIAAWHILNHSDEEDPLILLMPADHAVTHPEVLHQALEKACAVAQDGRLICFGIEPEYPETGYGYIEGGEEISPSIQKVRRFTEKPKEPQARAWIKKGGYYWNSGMFLANARSLMAQFDHCAPTIAHAARQAWNERREDAPFLQLPHAIYEKQPVQSIDYAVMEKTPEAAVVATKKMGWSDLGTWKSVCRFLEHPNSHPETRDVTALHCENSTLIADQPHSIAALGLKDIIVVASDGVTLVADRRRQNDIPKLHAAWRKSQDKDRLSRAPYYRPWGSYQIIDQGEGFLVKRITVNPRGILSLQYHHHRDEHWVVVQGSAHVTRDAESIVLEKNQSIDIARQQHHRLENRGSVPLIIIETQSGPILSEEDIVRLEDVYGRVKNDSPGTS